MAIIARNHPISIGSIEANRALLWPARKLGRFLMSLIRFLAKNSATLLQLDFSVLNRLFPIAKLGGAEC